MLILMALAAGCSDDENCTCSPPITYGTIGAGYTNIGESQLRFSCYFWNNVATLPTVDSVMIDGYLCELTTYYEGEMGMTVEAWLEQEMPRRAPAAQSDIDIAVYTPDGVAEATVTALDYDLDTLAIITPSTIAPNDSVAVGDPVTVTWHRVAEADWYYLYYYLRHDSSGTVVYNDYTYAITGSDTTYSIPGAGTFDDGHLYLAVEAVTGPRPGHTGNLIGPNLQGHIMSAVYRGFVRVIVGDGIPDSAPGEPVPELSARDRLLRLYR